MKTSWLILSIFIASTLFGQSNFTIENGFVSWQKVYESNLSYGEIVQAVKESGRFESIQESENKIIFQIKPIAIDYKAAGYTNMQTPMYISMYNYTAFAVLSYKENKYRIVLKNISVNAFADLPVNTLPENKNLEYYAIKNGQFRSGFLKTDAKIFDFTFTRLFKFEKVKDW